MKMAAITTRSEGRELEPLSLRAKAVGDPDLSECATFLSLKPSSWGEEKKTDGKNHKYIIRIVKTELKVPYLLVNI